MGQVPVDPRHPFRNRIRVVLSGDLPPCARGWAIDEVERAATHESFPLLRARVRLHRSQRVVPACRAEVLVDLGGFIVHGRGEADSPREALHRAAEHVRRQARGVGARPRTAWTFQITGRSL